MAVFNKYKNILNKLAALSIFMVFASSLVSCASSDSTDPVTVASNFWAAMLSATPSTARLYISDPSNVNPVFNGYTEGDTFRLIKKEEQNGFLLIRTNLIIQREGIITIPLQTVLTKTTGTWTVDYASTMSSVYDTSVDAAIDQFLSTVITSVDTLEAFIPGKNVNDEKVLLAELEVLMKEYAVEMYHGITASRAAAKTYYENRSGGAHAQREALLNKINQGLSEAKE